jgi:hypothetical protein
MDSRIGKNWAALKQLYMMGTIDANKQKLQMAKIANN